MRTPRFTPPPEAIPDLPLDYFDMPIEERARALQIAGRAMADDVFERFFATIAGKPKTT